jgi:mannitol operon transcriptional antiterminator
MTFLTTQQRNILHQLLSAEAPLAVSELAARLKLTPRQVIYRLKPVQLWLTERHAILKSTPGVGVTVQCSPALRQNLLVELMSQSDFQLILTAGQRQQLLALSLLTASEPLILNNLQRMIDVSRSTVLKDMPAIEAWSRRFELDLIRKPNYGIAFDGAEQSRRQALIALLWGDIPFEHTLTSMAHGIGLTFLLAGNYALPIVQNANQFIRKLNTETAFEWVAFAEDQLGGRFTDDAVLHLALALAVQANRVNSGRFIEVAPETLAWLQTKKMWPVALNLFRIMWPPRHPEELPAEIAAIAMLLLSGLRNHLWPGDLDLEPNLTEMVTELMGEVSMAFSTPGLRQDPSLRDGLVAHIIPSFMQQRFGLWSPPSWSDGTLSMEYQREYAVASELALLVTERTGVVLPAGDVDTLTLLLRAAFIRESPNQPKRVYIICPSGMATAQLLVARLKARFPSLDILGVLSLRELSAERVAEAQLLISTAPVKSPRRGLEIIQVHPLLLTEDIEKITNWLASAAGHTTDNQ